MSDLPQPDTTDMSCPLLNKLAPETRVLIYEYVLSFGMPVKHATNLKPFLHKLTGSKTNLKISDKHATRSKAFLEKFTESKSDPELESAGADDESAEAEKDNESDWESIEGEDDSDLQSTEAELQSSPSTEATSEPEPLRLVNTSILAASKLIYKEAIAVF